MDNTTALWSAIIACSYGELVDAAAALRDMQDTIGGDYSDAETWARLLHATAENAMSTDNG